VLSATTYLCIRARISPSTCQLLSRDFFVCVNVQIPGYEITASCQHASVSVFGRETSQLLFSEEYSHTHPSIRQSIHETRHDQLKMRSLPSNADVQIPKPERKRCSQPKTFLIRAPPINSQGSCRSFPLAIISQYQYPKAETAS